METSGICRLRCRDCEATYVGRTYRKLKTRYKEHLNWRDSKFYKHINDPGNKEIKIDMRNSKNNLSRQEEIKITAMLGDSSPSLLLISDRERQDLSRIGDEHLSLGK